jgi:SPP1 family predicted phage head-tail adaptor
MPRAGAFDRIITVQHATESQDDTGQPVLVWEDYLERWAAVRHLYGRELMIASQLVANVDTEFRMRYDVALRTVTPEESFRIAYEDRLYDIQYSQENVPEDGRRRGWRILARTRTEEAP